MIDAYHSGDPYLYTAKLAGAIPWDGTKEEYSDIRDKFKAVVLGILYGMAAKGLAAKLTNDLGRPVDESEAEELILLIREAYPDYEYYKSDLWYRYNDYGYLRLPCGWTMWGDNPNRRSVGNFPIQGMGACIMRRAVATAMQDGLEVIMTLHDALYVECDSDSIDTTLSLLSKNMNDACLHYFPVGLQPYASCRQDPTIWSPDFDDEVHDTELGPVKHYRRYVEPSSVSDFNKYQKYLISEEDHELLATI